MLLISILKLLGQSDDLILLVASELHPLVLHGLGKADFGDQSTNLSLNIRLENLFSSDESGSVLELRGSICRVALSFGGESESSALNDFKHDIFVNEKTLDSCVDLSGNNVLAGNDCC